MSIPKQKMYKPGKLQAVLDEFMHTNALAVKINLHPNEYKNKASAQSSYRSAIRRSKYPIVARNIKRSLYLIKLEPEKCKPKTCIGCVHSLEDGFYNPWDWFCKECVLQNKWEAKK